MKTLKYKGHLYAQVAYTEEDVLTYEQIRPHGAMEIGSAYCPAGEVHPGWADTRGRKFAEVTPPDGMRSQAFVRIDNLDGWRWEWDEGASQEDVEETHKMNKVAKYIRVGGSLYVLASEDLATGRVIHYLESYPERAYEISTYDTTNKLSLQEKLRVFLTADMIGRGKSPYPLYLVMEVVIREGMNTVDWDQVAKEAEKIIEEYKKKGEA